MTAFVLDCETTGLVEPRVVEMAWLQLEPPDEASLICAEFCQRYNPGQPIEYGAMATHHITLEDLVGEPFWDDPARGVAASLPSDMGYLIGHNVDYDWAVIGSPNVKRIDTLALARSLWPNLDSHRLGALMYFLFPSIAKNRLTRAHSAVGDAECCWCILGAILSRQPVATWEALWELSERARVPTVMPYGKHKGLPIGQVPADYRRWLLGQPDVDPYLRKALEGAAR